MPYFTCFGILRMPYFTSFRVPFNKSCPSLPRLCFSQRILSFLMFFTLISMMRDQDSIIRWQTISEEVKIILIGFLMLDTSEKGDFSCFFHGKNLLLHNNKRRNIKRWNDVLTT